jgi:hypothetical protein
MAAAVIVTGALASSAAAQTKPVAAEPIRAVFDQERFLTRYEFTVSSRIRIRKVTFHWSLTPPTQDPGCDLLAVQRATRHGKARIGHASWLHGDHHGCNHEVSDEDGHPGFVHVAARIVTSVRGTWVCSSTIHGTVTAVSTYRPTCRKEGAG